MTTLAKYADVRRLITRLYTRKCRGCADAGIHNAHLTPLGRLRYTGSIAWVPRSTAGNAT